jgi:hypothetical protein
MDGPRKKASLTFDDILRGAEPGRGSFDVATLHQFRADNGALSKRQVDTLVKSVGELIDGGRSNAAAELPFAGLVVDGPAVLVDVQKSGLFRLSRRRCIGGATSVAARLVCQAIETCTASSF